MITGSFEQVCRRSTKQPTTFTWSAKENNSDLFLRHSHFSVPSIVERKMKRQRER